MAHSIWSTTKHSHCETVYAKELFQWLFFELVHSLRTLSIHPTFKVAGLIKEWQRCTKKLHLIWVWNLKFKHFKNWTLLRCIFVPNLEIATSIGGALWHGQARNGVNFWLWSSIWPWSSRSIVPQNNRDLNQGILHLWSKFGDPSLNAWWVNAWTS